LLKRGEDCGHVKVQIRDGDIVENVWKNPEKNISLKGKGMFVINLR
jgi:hypothetical protein